MKVLSVKQPYAWLIAEGLKDVENRGVRTRHRGDLVIQASRTWKEKDVKDAIEHWMEEGAIDEAPSLREMKDQCGQAIAVVSLVDCVEGHESIWAVEGALHYLLEDVRKLGSPVPVRGRQSLAEMGAEETASVELAIIGLAVESSGKPRRAEGASIKVFPIDVVERAQVEVYRSRPHGTLPMDERFAVRVTDPQTGSDLYDSATLGDPGRFEEEVAAGAHAQAWMDGQRMRHGRIDAHRGRRRDKLPERLDEVDEAAGKVKAKAKIVAAALKKCAEDQIRLRDEARDPDVAISLVEGDFVMTDEPSLSEGTDRPWWGSRDEAGEIILPPGVA